MTNTSGWPGMVRSGCDRTRPARSSGDAERRAQRRRRDAGRPEHGLRLDRARLPISHGARRHARDRVARPHFDAKPLEIAAARPRAAAPETSRAPTGPPRAAGSAPRSGSKCRKSRASDCREISASAPASSTPVGPPPTTTNVSSACRRSCVRLALRPLERQQHAPADLERILERLQAGRGRPPLVMTEVGVRRAGRDDQIVVVRATPSASVQALRRAGSIATDIAEQHFDVALTAQDPADRRRDVAGRQRRRRHLIQQRLEDVMVAAIDERDPHRRPPQRARGVQAAEAAADDDDARIGHTFRALTFQPSARSDELSASHTLSFQLPASSFQPAFFPPCPGLSTVGFGPTLAVECAMTMSNHLVRWGGARLSRRLGRSLPWIGVAVGLLTIASTMKRKGVVGGAGCRSERRAVRRRRQERRRAGARTGLHPGSAARLKSYQLIASLDLHLPPTAIHPVQ